MNTEFLLFDGKLFESGESLISPGNRGIYYGEGCFETMRLSKGKVLHPERHFSRFQKGLDFLGHNRSIVSFDRFIHEVRVLMEANNLRTEDAYIRWQCWNEGERGYSQKIIRKPRFLMESGILPYRPKPVSLEISSVANTPAASHPKSFKLSNSIHYAMAARNAQANGFDDALLLSVRSFVSETSVSSVFWYKNNTCYTPSASCDSLESISSEIISKCISDSCSIPLVKGEFTADEIRQAECIWVCNSLKEICAVHALDTAACNTSHPVIKLVKKAFLEYKNKNLMKL